MPEIICPNLGAAQRYEDRVANRVWYALRDAGCWQEQRAGMGRSAAIQFDPVLLHCEGREQALGVLLGAVTRHPCVQHADILTCAATSHRRFARLLGGLVGKDVLHVSSVGEDLNRVAIDGMGPHAITFFSRGDEPDYPMGVVHNLTGREVPQGITSPEFYDQFGFWPRHAGRRAVA